MKILVVFAFSMLVGLGGCADHAKGDVQLYSVRLSRGQTVGDTYDLEASGSRRESRVTVYGGKRVESAPRELSVQLEGKVTVLEVDALGQPVKLICEVKRFRRILKDGWVVILGSGVKVTAQTTEGRTSFEMDSGKVSSAEESALRLVLMTSTSHEVSLDQLFGVQRPQPVGAAWPVHRESAVKLVSRAGVMVSEDNVSGSVKLDSATGQAPNQLLTVVAVLDVKHAQLPPRGGAGNRREDISLMLTRVLPLDEKQQPTEESVRVSRVVSSSKQMDGGVGDVSDSSVEERLEKIAHYTTRGVGG